jgi:hypothetical protein
MPMCNNAEKARFLKILVDEIKAGLAKRKAGRAATPPVVKAPPAWAPVPPGAVAGYRR